MGREYSFTHMPFEEPDRNDESFQESSMKDGPLAFRQGPGIVEETQVQQGPETLSPSLEHTSEAETGFPRTARDKNPIARFEVNQGASVKKNLSIKSGSGTKFADIPTIVEHLSKRSGSDEILKGLHRLLFGRPGEAKKVKSHLREFSGMVFSDDHERELFKRNLEKWTTAHLKDLCNVLALEGSGTKDVVIERLTEFLVEPRVTGRKPRSMRKRKTKRRSKKLSKDGTKKQTPHRIAMQPAGLQRYVETARQSPEFNDPAMSREQIDTILADRWASMSEDARNSYEPASMKEDNQQCRPGPSDERGRQAHETTLSVSLSPQSIVPDEDAIRNHVDKLLKSADLSQLSKKSIRESLSRDLNMDLSEHRRTINEIIEKCLSRL